MSSLHEQPGMPYTYERPHPAVTTDIVVFTIRSGGLAILLIRRAQEPFRGEWALPGGFVEPDEGLEAAAQRELDEETGVRGVFLEQLYTFGEPDRDPRERVITVAYYALVPPDRIEPEAASDADQVGWFGVGRLPELAFDHADIIGKALDRLAARAGYSTIALELMPESFTLTELQHVHELLVRETVDKRNFRKRMLALGVIEATGEQKREGPHRPARLYRVIDRSKVDVIG